MSSGPTISTRVERERSFYNESSGASHYRQLRSLIWRAIGEFNRHHEFYRLFDPRGKSVLQYGCGPGFGVKSLLERGATHVVGIDISEEEIDRAREAAEHGGHADQTSFSAQDAHNTDFPDDTFDLVVGQSILHHLELSVALAELRRILRPGGTAVFSEPLAHNPVLRLGRVLTPGARTADEHPLTVADWDLCNSVFPGFEHVEVELTSVFIMPINLFVPRRWQRALASRVAKLDDALLRRFPVLRPHARLTFLVFTLPLTDDAR